MAIIKMMNRVEQNRILGEVVGVECECARLYYETKGFCSCGGSGSGNIIIHLFDESITLICRVQVYCPKDGRTELRI